MEKFIGRDLVEEKLKEKIGLRRVGWLTNEFRDGWESEYNYEQKGPFKFEILDYIINFLSKQDISNIIFFPDSYGWQTYSDNGKEEKLSAVKFVSANEAKEFLKREIFWGADNYYISNNNFDWILTICHEGDLHINGSKKFVEDFKKRYLIYNK